MAAQGRPAADRRAILAVRVVETACVAGLAWIAGLLVWTLFAPESVAPAEPTVAAPAANGPARPVIDRTVLWRTRPFTPSDAPAATASEAAPETTLNLRLAGVAAGVGATPGTAFILTPDNRQHAFAEGDTIIDGVTLERVFADRTTIRRNGAVETLYLPGATREAPVPAPSPDQPAPVPAVADGLTADRLYDAMQVEAVMRDGRIAGMRLARAADPAVTAAAGLAEGDILMDVAGRRLADVADFNDLFESLRDADSVSIVVERAGARVPLTVSFGTAQ